jgi:hypothetical protein
MTRTGAGSLLPGYRSIRGSPKCGKTLVSVNQVIGAVA